MTHQIDVYEFAGDESASTTVIRALAAASGADPAEMDVRLYDAIDPELLDAVYRSSGEAGTGPRLTFRIGDYHVTVDESCDVHITTDPEQTETTEAPPEPGPNPLTNAPSHRRIAFDD